MVKSVSSGPQTVKSVRSGPPTINLPITRGTLISWATAIICLPVQQNSTVAGEFKHDQKLADMNFSLTRFVIG